MNKAILMGHLGRDPETRSTQSGSSVCNFSLAINERRKSGNEWVQHTEWVNIVSFGTTAENCSKYLAKGSQCLVEGRIQTRKWEKDGENRYSTEVVAERVQFLSKADRGEHQSTPLPVPPKAVAEPQMSFDDDDIPF